MSRYVLLTLLAVSICSCGNVRSTLGSADVDPPSRGSEELWAAAPVASMCGSATSPLRYAVGHFERESLGDGGGWPTEEPIAVTSGLELQSAISCQRARNSSQPVTIVIDGVIRRETSPDSIEIRGVENVVLVGAGAGAEFDRVGIRLTQSSNVTIRKVHVPLLIVGEIEAVGIQGYVDNVWVENTELDAPSDPDIHDYREALVGCVNQYPTRT